MRLVKGESPPVVVLIPKTQKGQAVKVTVQEGYYLPAFIHETRRKGGAATFVRNRVNAEEGSGLA